MVYRANVVRYLDKKGNKSLIQFNDDYDDNGLLKKITFSFIGVGTSSGILHDQVYDFENLTINNQPFLEKGLLGTKESLKNKLLNLFNKNDKFILICPKDSCNDLNCRPHLSIGNKITQSENTKQPYFSSNCDGINYGETPEHLNAKINIHKLLMEKSASYSKKGSATKIENIEIEKTFSSGNGQERRADVYYEKQYTKTNGELVIEKFAIEVQRSNINYGELLERTQWYTNNGIAPFWIIVDNIFDSDNTIVEDLSKKNFGLPLLTLISFSMTQYNDRFFIYDDKIKKIIGLTVRQENLVDFNTLPHEAQLKIKSKFSLENLFIISNIKEDDKHYQLLPYKLNRNTNNFGSDLLSFGIFPEKKLIAHKIWNNGDKKFEYAHFKKLGQFTKNIDNNKKMKIF